MLQEGLYIQGQGEKVRKSKSSTGGVRILNAMAHVKTVSGSTGPVRNVYST